MTEPWHEMMQNEMRDAVRALGASVAETAPAPAAFVAAARRLRGTAFLARQESVSALAAALERLGTSIESRAVRWDVATSSATREAVALLQRLDEHVPTAMEERTLELLTGRLQRLAPAPSPDEARGEGADFLASHLTTIVTALRALSRAGAADVADATRRQLQRLRGAAAVGAMPPLAEVLKALEHAVAEVPPLVGLGRGPLPLSHETLFRAGAEVLEEALAPIAAGALPPTDSAAVAGFAGALRVHCAAPSFDTPIVPIHTLLASESAGDLPPRDSLRARARFQREASPFAEALRARVSEGRAVGDPVTRARVSADLTETVQRLATLADGFLEPRTASVLRAALEGAHRLDAKALWVLDDLGAVLSDPSGRLAELDHAIALLEARLDGLQPAPTAAPLARERRPTPSAATPTLPSIAAFLLPSSTSA